MQNKHYPKDGQLIKWVTKDGQSRSGQFYKKERMFCYVYNENIISEWDITASVKQWQPLLDLKCEDCDTEFNSDEHSICPNCHSEKLIDVIAPLKTKRGPYNTPKIETVTINFRVPKSLKNDAKDFIRPLLKEFITQTIKVS